MTTDTLPFDFNSVPYTWALCFNDTCPMHDTCMRHFAGRHMPTGRAQGPAVYPAALQKGKCRLFVEKRVIRSAWGFSKLFLDVKRVDDTPIRREIQRYLGCRSTYYRYMSGRFTLTPEQQADILEIFRTYGYTAPRDFDNYVEHYVYE